MVILIVLFFAVLMSGSVSAATINVNNKTTNSIKNAINTASDGDTLSLSAGTYREHDISINKNLTIIGPKPTSGNSPTAVIDAQNQGRVFNVSTREINVTLKYLSIKNGKSTSGYGGGGIQNFGNLTVVGCDINNNINGEIYNVFYSTMKVVDSDIHNNNNGGIDNCGTLTLTDSNIHNNSNSGICNDSTSILNVTGSNIHDNTATYGGGIYNAGYCTVTNSNIYNNKASNGGGFYNYKNLNVISSNIYSNTATSDGGGIYNYYDDFLGYGGAVDVTSSNLVSNTANRGGGLYNLCTSILSFCRITGNTATQGSDIHSYGAADAKWFNWWGSNADPSSRVWGDVTVSPWLVLKVTANSILIENSESSNISASLLYDSDGGYHDPTSGHVPDGIPVTFTTTLGLINGSLSTLNGVATATLNGNSGTGLADISAKVDSETTQTTVKFVDTKAPTITSSNPSNGATNISPSKTITMTFNENIKEGNTHIELKNSSGTAIPFTTSIIGKILYIDPKNNLAESQYTLTIYTGAVADLTGNSVSPKTIKFSAGTSPKVSIVDPKNSATKVTRSKTIKVTFNEYIKAGSKYWIELKTSAGKLVSISKSISGKVLTIKHARLAANTKYKLILHTGSITDKAGNSAAAKTYYFTTGTA